MDAKRLKENLRDVDELAELTLVLNESHMYNLDL